MALTPVPPSNPSAPNDLTEVNEGATQAPQDLTEVSEGATSAPQNLTEVAEGSTVAPNNLAEIAEGATAFPNDLTEVAEGATAAPNNLTEIAEGALAAPNQLGREPTTNIALYSEQFDNAVWTKENSSVVADAELSPFGDLTADAVVENSANSTHRVAQTISFVSGQQYTFSVYVRQRTGDRDAFLQLGTGAFPSSAQVAYDLATGEAIGGTIGGGLDDYGIQKIGDYYRCWITATASSTASTSASVYLYNGAASYLGDGTSSLAVFGAQVEVGVKLSSYLATTDTIRTEGQTVAPIQLAKEPTTNLILRSEEFDNAAWTKLGSSVTADQAPDINGDLVADRFEADATGTVQPRINQSFTTVVGEEYTVSVYVRRSEVRWFQVYFGGGDVSGDPHINFDLLDGVVGTTSGLRTAINPAYVWSGAIFYRVQVTFTAAVTDTLVVFMLQDSDDGRSNSSSFTIGDGLFIWGAQAENTPQATSYLRTQGAIATEGVTSAPNNLAELAIPRLSRTFRPVLNLDFMSELYAENDEPKALDDIITYARNSSATFWNRRKLISGRYQTFIDNDYVGSVTNLYTYSEDFTNADWSKSSNTSVEVVTNEFFEGRQVHRIIKNAAGFKNVSQDITEGSDLTVYFIVKAETLKSASVRVAGTGINGADTATAYQFSLVNGSYSDQTGASSDDTIAFSEYLGDGWWKIGITPDSFTTITETNLYVEWDETVAGSILVARAQATDSRYALPYVQTLASTASETFVEVPRIAYDPVTAEPLGYQVEGGSTNVITQSEEIDGSDWGETGTSLQKNRAISPDGTKNADHLREDSTAASQHRINQGGKSLTNATDYTASVFLKQARGSRYVRVLLFSSLGAVNSSATFDLINGVVQDTGGAEFVAARIVPVGNDWYHCELTVTAASTQTDGQVLINLIDGSNSSYNGDGTSGVYVWGVQLEEESFATSYIRTNSASASRSADDMTANGGIAQLINEPETIFVEARLSHDNQFDGTNPKSFYGTNVDPQYFRINTGNQLEYRKGNNAALNSVSSFDTTVMTKWVATSDGATLRTYRNGVQLANTQVVDGVDNYNATIAVGEAAHTPAQSLYGFMGRLAIYRINMTDEEISRL